MIRRDSQEQFDRQAQHYNAQWNQWSEESLRWLLARAHAESHHQLLDVATGTGFTALAFAPLVAEVTGTDVSSAPFLKSLGFDFVTFSYPLTTLSSSFLGHADSPLVSYDPEELHRTFDEVKKLKRQIHVVNPTVSIEEMQRFLRKEPQRFPCLGGFKYFYLDWNFLFWRCHFWETPICSIFDFDDSRRIRDGCTRCMIDCYRDASVMQHVGVAVADAAMHLRKGCAGAAVKALFNREVLDSLKSVVEGKGWINRI